MGEWWTLQVVRLFRKQLHDIRGPKTNPQRWYLKTNKNFLISVHCDRTAVVCRCSTDSSNDQTFTWKANQRSTWKNGGHKNMSFAGEKIYLSGKRLLPLDKITIGQAINGTFQIAAALVYLVDHLKSAQYPYSCWLLFHCNMLWFMILNQDQERRCESTTKNFFISFLNMLLYLVLVGRFQSCLTLEHRQLQPPQQIHSNGVLKSVSLSIDYKLCSIRLAVITRLVIAYPDTCYSILKPSLTIKTINSFLKIFNIF